MYTCIDHNKDVGNCTRHNLDAESIWLAEMDLVVTILVFIITFVGHLLFIHAMNCKSDMLCFCL